MEPGKVKRQCFRGQMPRIVARDLDGDDDPLEQGTGEERQNGSGNHDLNEGEAAFGGSGGRVLHGGYIVVLSDSA